ncbi:MAG: phosphate/phosphite/phosphonate ABC transporter substrate-binding protein [Alphaproteobacteria bacterium]|nr:phosphate/phosphite/phosphonate ABC transporter substrate-binding protein [Alphaproteobacteria bacterium]
MKPALLSSFLLAAGLCIAVTAVPSNGARAEAQAGAEAAPGNTLVLGRITGNPRKQLPKMTDFAAYLAGKLKDLGVGRVNTLAVPDRAAMARALKDGRVDFYSETVLSALYLEAYGEGEILLREWKKGVASYRSVIVAKVGSGITELADLRGGKVAFEDPSSTSGFLFPYGALTDAGLTLNQLPSPRANVAAASVGYVFAEEELNIAGWVVRGIVDAGAMSDQDLKDLTRVPGPIKKSLKVLYRSPALPRSLFSVRRGLEARIKARIKAVLLKMHQDPAAKPVLEKYYRVKKYDEVLDLGYPRRITGLLAARGM